MSHEIRAARPYDAEPELHTPDAVAKEKARCLAIATDVLTRGPGFPCCSEFADGYSNAAQQIAAEIEGGAVPITQQLCNMHADDGLVTRGASNYYAAIASTAKEGE